jgi:uncharacterized membrane protein
MRYFHEDPRFGLITLSEIASRALSVNDPSTAIQIISSHVRLFSVWAEVGDGKRKRRPAVPELYWRSI